MTMPPGWYPDPGHAGDGPAPERWWDGTNWTGRTRTTESSGSPGSPDTDDTEDVPVIGAAPYQVPDLRPPTARGRRGRIALIAAGAAVLAAVAAGAVLLLGGSGGDSGAPAAGSEPESGTGAGPEPDPGTGPGTDDAPPTGTPEPSAPPEEHRRYTDAAVGGAALPVPEGWTERTHDGAAVTYAEHPCPEDPALVCATAGAFLALGGPGSARDAAEADIEAHTAASYSEDAYGGVAAHRDELSSEITVAGNEGYRVRRWVETGSGTEAYAETVAFPAPDGSGRLLLLRLGWTVTEGAPGEGEMTGLVAGVQAAPEAGRDAGAGTDV